MPRTTKKIKRRAGKAKKQVVGLMGAKMYQYMCLMVVAVIIGASMFFAGGFAFSSFWQDDGLHTTTTTTPPYWWNTNTGTTTTTTTTPITTTTPPPPPKYTWKAMWTWEPIMGIDRPAWIMTGLWWNLEPSNVIESIFMNNPSSWYYGAEYVKFDAGVTYRLYIGDPMNDGWEFTLDGYDYILISPALVGYSWDLMQGEDSWGHLYFEWLEIVRI